MTSTVRLSTRAAPPRGCWAAHIHWDAADVAHQPQLQVVPAAPGSAAAPARSLQRAWVADRCLCGARGTAAFASSGSPRWTPPLCSGCKQRRSVPSPVLPLRHVWTTMHRHGVAKGQLQPARPSLTRCAWFLAPLGGPRCERRRYVGVRRSVPSPVRSLRHVWMTMHCRGAAKGQIRPAWLSQT